MKKHSDLRDEVDVTYIFGEVKMWYEARKQQNCVGVVVEAKPDEILFRKLLHQHCIFFPAQGWEKVVAVLAKTKEHGLATVIGIIDADFKRILNYNCPENIFLTDYHDTEIMLAYSDAWDNVVNQYCDIKKLANFEQQTKTTLLNFLLSMIRPLSILRFLKEKYQLNWKFKTPKGEKYDYIKYKDFIDTDKLILDINKLFTALEQKSQSLGFFKNNPQYIAELSALSKENQDLKEWSNGHDLMNVLALALEKAVGNKASSNSISGEELEKSFSIAYRITDFEKTQLYTALQDWQDKYVGLSVLQ